MLWRGTALRLVVLHLKPRREEECAAHADLAFHPDAAVHQFHQLLRDGQAQTRAAVLAGSGTVGLGETLEDEPELVLGDADAGIGDGEAETSRPVVFGIRLDPHFEPALVGELDRVAEQVDEDLAQPVRIADQITRDVRRYGLAQPKTFGGRARLHHFHGTRDHFAQIQIGRFQFDAARTRLWKGRECR